MAGSSNLTGQRWGDGIEVVCRIVRDTLDARMDVDDAERLAATVLGEVASRFILRRSALWRNALFETDLADALCPILDDPDVLMLSGRERTGMVAASLLAALDDTWDFRLRSDWFRQSAEAIPPPR